MLHRLINRFRAPQTAVPCPERYNLDRAARDFALVLVEAQTDAQIAWTSGAVTEAAAHAGGNVLQILGSLVLVVFRHGSAAAARRDRLAFAERVAREHRQFVSVLHGRTSCLVGTLGGAGRLSFTVVPDGFRGALGRLAALAPGELAEYGDIDGQD